MAAGWDCRGRVATISPAAGAAVRVALPGPLS